MGIPLIGRDKDKPDKPNDRYAVIQYAGISNSMCVGGTELLKIVHYNKNKQAVQIEDYSQKRVEQLRDQGIVVVEKEDASGPLSCQQITDRQAVLNRLRTEGI